MEDNRTKALDAAVSQIERQFGKGTIMRMGDEHREVIPSISTGSLGLILRWVLAVYLKAVWLRFTGRSHQVKRR